MKKSREKKENVVIRRGSSVIVKETVIEDNLGDRKSVNDKPPGEVEIVCSSSMLKVKQSGYSKWVHWVSERLKDKMNKQGRIDYLGQGISFASEIHEAERKKEYWDDMSGKKLKEEKVKMQEKKKWLK